MTNLELTLHLKYLILTKAIKYENYSMNNIRKLAFQLESANIADLLSMYRKWVSLDTDLLIGWKRKKHG